MQFILIEEKTEFINNNFNFNDDNIGYIGYKYHNCYIDLPIYYCGDATSQLAEAKFCNYNECQLPIMSGDLYYHDACRYDECTGKCCPCCCDICGYMDQGPWGMTYDYKYMTFADQEDLEYQDVITEELDRTIGRFVQ